MVGQISLSNYTTDQAVIDSEVANVLQFGAEELNQGTLSSEYFWNWQPGEIYVYAVGITIDGTVTTPLYKQSITIPAAPIISTTPNYPFYNPLQIPVEGGTFEVSYTVENPVASTAGIDTARLFERFYQADSARHAAGSGLGLAVSANLAHAMGMGLTAHLSDAAPRSLSITLACPR